MDEYGVKLANKPFYLRIAPHLGVMNSIREVIVGTILHICSSLNSCIKSKKGRPE